MAKKSHEIRQAFVDYFVKNGHRHENSSRLIPEDDPTLLFTNAGMNQFKNLFLGLEKRDYKRAVTSQKCVRAGGKHNDLENVGHTARHHTFFEMLGNFSFGDYFKKDAIHFAWEFITKELALPKDKLYVSVFENDDEAADIWHKQEGVPRDRIYRFGEKDNFWRMGDSGPCGPCSEIFYDLGPEVGGDPKENVMGGSGDRYIEFWNLVFMQFHEDGKGGRFPLPNPSIDTGMGLERLTTILQGELSNYHTDAFQDLIHEACRLSGATYHKDISKFKAGERTSVDEINVALRVLADHARATAFLIGDGVLPSNEGRGYVLRRILRRALRFGHKLSEQSGLFPAVVKKVCEKMGGVYPELSSQGKLIMQTVTDEEQRFLSTLSQGTEILNEELRKLDGKGLKTLSGEVSFKLYDTYGFPLDLTQLMAQERGFKIDEAGFQEHMETAREKARASWKGKGLAADKAQLIQLTQAFKDKQGPTKFVGYTATDLNSEKALQLISEKGVVSVLKKDEVGFLLFAQTPFYAEGGGQTSDHGVVRGGAGEAEVLDCQKINEIFVHSVRVTDGQIKQGDVCQLAVTGSKRRAVANNHSATHLMHAALKKVLGEHVGQAGSLVTAEKLRFDFTHNKPMSPAEISEVENLVNQEVGLARTVESKVMSHKEAIKAGAVAMFGEKYGDEVRVIRMGDFSMELCGGTHVANTSVIRFFKVLSEGGVSAGVRRIEAITGDLAIQLAMTNLRENQAAKNLAGTTDLVKWIEDQKEDKKILEKKLQAAKGQQVDIEQMMAEAREFSSHGKKGRLIFVDVKVDDRKVLSDLSDRLRDKLQSAVVVLVGHGESTHPVIVSVSKNLQPEINAGKVLAEVATQMGGKGGGRPDFAQGAVPNREAFKTAKQHTEKIFGLN